MDLPWAPALWVPLFICDYLKCGNVEIMSQLSWKITSTFPLQQQRRGYSGRKRWADSGRCRMKHLSFSIISFYVPLCVCVCVCRSKVDICCLLWLFSIYWGMVFWWTWSSPIWLRQLAPGDPCQLLGSEVGHQACLALLCVLGTLISVLTFVWPAPLCAKPPPRPHSSHFSTFVCFHIFYNVFIYMALKKLGPNSHAINHIHLKCTIY